MFHLLVNKPPCLHLRNKEALLHLPQEPNLLLQCMKRGQPLLLPNQLATETLLPRLVLQNTLANQDHSQLISRVRICF